MLQRIHFKADYLKMFSSYLYYTIPLQADEKSFIPQLKFTLSNGAASFVAVPLNNLLLNSCSNLNKTNAWLSSAIKIVAISALAISLYSLTSSLILKGLITGAYKNIMQVFPLKTKDKHPTPTLISTISNKFLPSKEINTEMHIKSEMWAEGIFAISSLFSLIIYQHPIIAASISYPLAAVGYLLSLNYLSQNQTSSDALALV